MKGDMGLETKLLLTACAGGEWDLHIRGTK